jgi:hypothetical protein
MTNRTLLIIRLQSEAWFFCCCHFPAEKKYERMKRWGGDHRGGEK